MGELFATSFRASRTDQGCAVWNAGRRHRAITISLIVGRRAASGSGNCPAITSALKCMSGV